MKRRCQPFFFAFLRKFFSFTETGISAQSAPRMSLNETIRVLIEQAITTGDQLTLARISRKTGVKYKRLWNFMNESKGGRLTVDDAQRIYETLSGTPLLPLQ
jgi:hypothetical protein